LTDFFLNARAIHLAVYRVEQGSPLALNALKSPEKLNMALQKNDKPEKNREPICHPKS